MNLFLLFSCFSIVSSFSSPLPCNLAFSTTTSLASSVSEELATMTEVKVGDKIPSVELKELKTGEERPAVVSLAELIAGKKVAIFGVPGAFTPGCSKSHLPSFMTAQDELKAKGVDLTICVATNDAYVMEAWGRTSGGSDSGILFLADDSGDLTRQFGLAMDTPVGLRTKRFSLIADDGVVSHYFSSAEAASNTWAPAVLSSL
mmetsp:Transcript_19996/g.25767  ORF Transcript_19996/g.25767 Transcript_19996/m.25767 type:complete len:203 (-) Transcript_19996:190-798(-)